MIWEEMYKNGQQKILFPKKNFVQLGVEIVDVNMLCGEQVIETRHMTKKHMRMLDLELQCICKRLNEYKFKAKKYPKILAFNAKTWYNTK